MAIGLAAALLQGGCLMLPRKGTPVWVDHRAGDFWSGEGMLVEVSGDQLHCRVYVRNTAGIVERRWVQCKHVHERDS